MGAPYHKLEKAFIRELKKAGFSHAKIAKIFGTSRACIVQSQPLPFYEKPGYVGHRKRRKAK